MRYLVTLLAGIIVAGPALAQYPDMGGQGSRAAMLRNLDPEQRRMVIECARSTPKGPDGRPERQQVMRCLYAKGFDFQALAAQRSSQRYGQQYRQMDDYDYLYDPAYPYSELEKW